MYYCYSQKPSKTHKIVLSVFIEFDNFIFRKFMVKFFELFRLITSWNPSTGNVHDWRSGSNLRPGNSIELQ